MNRKSVPSKQLKELRPLDVLNLDDPTLEGMIERQTGHSIDQLHSEMRYVGGTGAILTQSDRMVDEVKSAAYILAQLGITYDQIFGPLRCLMSYIVNKSCGDKNGSLILQSTPIFLTKDGFTIVLDLHYHEGRVPAIDDWDSMASPFMDGQSSKCELHISRQGADEELVVSKLNLTDSFVDNCFFQGRGNTYFLDPAKAVYLLGIGNKELQEKARELEVKEIYKTIRRRLGRRDSTHLGGLVMGQLLPYNLRNNLPIDELVKLLEQGVECSSVNDNPKLELDELRVVIELLGMIDQPDYLKIISAYYTEKLQSFIEGDRKKDENRRVYGRLPLRNALGGLHTILTYYPQKRQRVMRVFNLLHELLKESEPKLKFLDNSQYIARLAVYAKEATTKNEDDKVHVTPAYIPISISDIIKDYPRLQPGPEFSLDTKYKFFERRSGLKH